MYNKNRFISYLVVMQFLLTALLFFGTSPSFADDHSSVADSSSYTYLLGAGDRLRINIFGEEDLSDEYEIAPSGKLSLPLIGSVDAVNADTDSLSKKIKSLYKDGYLINPRISIEVINFRPFFILGEVNKPASYPYVNGLTVLNAIALAGGHTHRARTDRVMILRESVSKDKEFKALDDTIVRPGDIIRVPERFF